MEKVIIESEKYSLKLFNIILAVSVVVIVVALIPVLVYGLPEIIVPCILALPIPIIILNLYFNKMRLVVTNNRVYGNAAFGKSIDLPIDSVTAVTTSNFMKSISISTSSGRINFSLIKNNVLIRSELIKLLNNRQESYKQRIKEEPEKNINSVPDELRKYKILLDDGIITKEEFDNKKKQLLNM